MLNSSMQGFQISIFYHFYLYTIRHVNVKRGVREKTNVACYCETNVLLFARLSVIMLFDTQLKLRKALEFPISELARSYWSNHVNPCVILIFFIVFSLKKFIVDYSSTQIKHNQRLCHNRDIEKPLPKLYLMQILRPVKGKTKT